MNAQRHSTDEHAAARAIAEWVHTRTPDEVGTLADSIWSLARAAQGFHPELADHARSLMEIGLDGEADRADPKPLVAMAGLLEDAAETLRRAARILERDRR